MQRYRPPAFLCDDGGMNRSLHLDFSQFRMNPLREQLGVSHTPDSPDSLIFFLTRSESAVNSAARVLDKLGMTRL